LLEEAQSVAEAGLNAKPGFRIDSNNLKQFGIAIQVYADRNSEQIPPMMTGTVAGTTESGFSWLAHLLPVMEQDTTYKQFDWTKNYSEAPNIALGRALRSDGFHCPTRGFRINNQASYGGQAVDYVSVSVTATSSTWGGLSDLDKIDRFNQPGTSPNFTGGNMQTMANKVNGAITFPTTHKWPARSRVTIGGVTDGMTYTALVGEKHLNPQKVGEALLDAPYNPTHISISSSPGGIRVIGLGLAAAPDSPTYTKAGLADAEDNFLRFGSWHSGITQFVFGDARVAQVKNSASPDSVLVPMAHRADGTPYSLP